MQIDWPEHLVLPQRASFKHFVQSMAWRIAQGHCRYGLPNRKKKYISRLKKEVEAYEKTGNLEHLFNAANYAYLESEAPQNPLFYYDPGVDSVTR